MSGAKIPVLLLARELHIGGTERQMTETAKRLDRSQFEPHVGCFRSIGIFGDELRDFGINLVEWPVTSYRSVSAVRGARDIAGYIRRHRIQIVHTWDFPLTTYAIPIARLATPALAVSSQRSERSLIPAGYRRLLPVIDRLAHAIVVNCKFLERQLIGQGVPAAKIEVCYNGVDVERFRPVPGAHPLTVGVVCALRPEKNLTLLVDAFAMVRDAAPGARLVIVGEGTELELLRERARDAGIAAICHFEPATANVADWLRCIDIFVLPSRSEALSNSIMEAMASGCCVLASAVGGTPELVRSEESGILFPPGDVRALSEALRRVILDRALRARLAEAGARSMRESFSGSASAARMQEIYLNLVAARNRGKEPAL